MSYEYDPTIEQLKNAVHYLCWLSNDSGRFMDDVRLNKVLWYSDAMWFLRTGSSLTGAAYMKKPRGPVLQEHSKVINQLIDEQRITEGRAVDPVTNGYTPVFDSIDIPEFHMDDEVKEMYQKVHQYVTRERTRREISDQSHGEIWELAEEGEEIPLYTAYAERLGNITPDQLKDAQSGW